jgi:hypothetical protein
MAHTYTGELAVMCDTFRPLFPTKAALGLEDMKYPASWEGEHFPRLAKHEPVGGNMMEADPKPKQVIAYRFGDLVDMYDNTVMAPKAAPGDSKPGNVWAPDPAQANGAPSPKKP